MPKSLVQALTVVLYIAMAVGLIWILVTFLQAAVDIVVAVVTVAGSLLGSVLTYSNNRLIEQEKAEAAQKEALEFEARQMRQTNYQNLLNGIAQIAKETSDEENKDFSALMLAHSESWAFAPNSIVERTSQFLEKPSSTALRELLVAMRKDIGLEELSNPENLIKNLYPKETKEVVITKKSGFGDGT